jgi:hypothetical protein
VSIAEAHLAKPPVQPLGDDSPTHPCALIISPVAHRPSLPRRDISHRPWGAILKDRQNDITVAWWITVLPGKFLALFVVGVNLIGDGLRDELDPTLARR